MKIVLLVGGFPPKKIAGTELATYQIGSQLANHGHEVVVITTLDEGLPHFEIINNFQVYRIPFRQIFPNMFLVSFIAGKINLDQIVFYYKINSVIRKIKPDIIHAQQITMSIHAFLGKLVCGTPYIIYARGHYFSEYEGIFKTLMHISLKFSDSFIVFSNSEKNKFLHYYTREMYVIPNGIEFKKYQINVENSIRLKYNIQNDEKVIIFIGRLHVQKGAIDLIPALSLIRKKLPYTRLFIIGNDQGELGKITQLIRNYDLEGAIILTGEINPEKLPEYLNASDVFVCPSHWEPFGRVLIEAMAAGLPIVSTNVDGIPEIITDGENGLLVNPRSPEEIAEKVIKILSDDMLYQKISKNNLEKVKNYSLEHVVKKIEDVYQACIKN